jgi:hypothetical protein
VYLVDDNKHQLDELMHVRRAVVEFSNGSIGTDQAPRLASQPTVYMASPFGLATMQVAFNCT